MRAMTRVSMAGLAAMLTMAGCSSAREPAKPLTAGVRATQDAPSQPSPLQTTHAQATAALSLPDAAVHSPKAPAPSRATDFKAVSRTASADAEPSADLATEGTETAEPVSYTDKAGDATGDLPPGAVNQESFDILRVDWAPVSPGDDSRGYSTSMTVVGTPRDDGFYATYGQFSNEGEACQLYNFLSPGAIAFANAFCGDSEHGTRRFIGRVQGGRVVSTPTAGGTSLMATFAAPALPRELEAAGGRLYGLGAFTSLCPAEPGDPGECHAHQDLDYATSSKHYRV